MPKHQTNLERPLSALDVIFTRRSVRAYTGQKLDQATIRALLDAAVRAPTAMHAEPWLFLVIQDEGTLKRYSDLTKTLSLAEMEQYAGLHWPPNAGKPRRTVGERMRTCQISQLHRSRDSASTQGCGSSSWRCCA